MEQNRLISGRGHTYIVLPYYSLAPLKKLKDLGISKAPDAPNEAREDSFLLLGGRRLVTADGSVGWGRGTPSRKMHSFILGWS